MPAVIQAPLWAHLEHSVSGGPMDCPRDWVQDIFKFTWEFHAVYVLVLSSNLFFAPVESNSNKSFIHEVESWKICFRLAEMLYQDDGCVSGTIREAQNLHKTEKRLRMDLWKKNLTNSGIHLDLGLFKPQILYVNANRIHWIGIGYQSSNILFPPDQ